MGHINDFPIEILALIFQSVAIASQVHPNWHEPAHLKFPFNTATVCVLWLNILKSRPQYWKSVIFDVAHDPTPLLDTLGLYTGGEIAVQVISTLSRGDVFREHKNPKDGGLNTKRQEASHVRKIITRLRPYLSTCGLIEFNLAYQSSLPSCADILTHHLPRLRTLILYCYVHDLDDQSLEIKIDWDTISLREPLHHPVFPALANLSLTGFSFMELFQLGPQWVEKFEAKDTDLSIGIHHFAFHKRSLRDSTGSRSVHAFLRTIALRGTYESFDLVLSDITIDYLPTIKPERYCIPFTEIAFDNVSRDFLSTFFASVTVEGLQAPVRQIHFENCSIPHIDREARVSTDKLFIGNTIISPSESDTEVHLNDSIYNAVSAFQPADLYLYNCEDLFDTFFEWLKGEDDHVDVKALSNLYIQYCGGFTSRGLCTFIQTRSAQSKKYGAGIVSPIKQLFVRGEYDPPLEKEDALWFRAAEDEIDVDWQLQSPDDVILFSTKGRTT
ncbi:hypothetical protein HYPSUDRAFT_91505 [Hypholoma sublateritium FD-334 SS-4]|uniref:F-box domain-containing protein n=1 Tax=Hypholoma sublateritium (strain FD-334 SS-4) TaxID=945553 RepID=A0A0D2NHG0_HYPSF|nr:hypothetical protein HYPSUDRAFT_91505 [Hypholoma sublateritium FD-334 SS-4]